MAKLAADCQTMAKVSHPSHDHTMNRMQLVKFFEQQTMIVLYWDGVSNVVRY
jgi:hypothetical protein